MMKTSYALGMNETKGQSYYSRKIDIGEQNNSQNLVVRGENVLEKELQFAQAIPSQRRVLVRQESSLQELL